MVRGGKKGDRPRKGSFAIDLHVHTSRYSSCSSIDPEQLPAAALRAGLSALVVTEHECVWPAEELALLRGLEPDLLLLKGSELRVEEGDFVVFGVSSWDGLMEPMSGAEMLGLVHERGGFAIWAHPFRYGEPAHRFAEYLRPDAVEVDSCNMDGRTMVRAASLAEKLGVLSVTASDAHTLAHVGRHRFTLPRPVTDERDLAECLRGMPGP